LILLSLGAGNEPPIRSQEQIDQLHPLEPEESLPLFENLQTLRREVGNRAAVLGFVGAPWTLAAYAIEGKSSKDYINIKRMAFSNRPCCINWQTRSRFTFAIKSMPVLKWYRCLTPGQGLSPQDFETFALAYQRAGSGTS